MAYFLKKTKTAHDTYLQIYESFYDPVRKGSAHRSIRPLGYVKKLQASGIEDPIAYYSAEVRRMNAQRKKESVRKISDQPPVRYLGYFPLKAIMEKMDIRRLLSFYRLTTDFDFDLYEVLSCLVYARCVNPCSKRRTYHEVLPFLNLDYSFSYDQMLTALEFFGKEYEKLVEMFTAQTAKTFGLHTEVTYFDCTNFYFEIDREDDFRKKGPSKENRRDPIIGLGLLLDAHQIPIGMKMYPGNESEKPVIRQVLASLKERHEVKGKTIQVADKGLNCAQNIYTALADGDGYLFSKSVRQLPEVEKTWVLLANDWRSVKDRDGKILYQWKECTDDFPYSFTDEEGKRHSFQVREKRVATYNPALAKKKRYEINRMVEKAKGLSASLAKRSEYGDCARYVNFKSTSKGKTTEDKVIAELNQKAIEEDLKLAGYNLLVTSELKAGAKEVCATYHNLWRIEESFRIMKSDLDARPVFLQKEETIKGHFLICYITVLLERIFQFCILKGKYSSSEIFSFFKGFTVVENKGTYINISIATKFLTELASLTGLPLDNFNLSPAKIKKVLSYRF
jgi:transposase